MNIELAKPAWPAQTFDRQLDSGTIRVWRVELDPLGDAFEYFHSLLNARERQRAVRLKRPTHQRRWIISRALLRILVGAYLGRRAETVAFSYGSLGKPGVPPDAGGSELGFNNTDCGGVGLYAFARDRQLGIDMEHWPRRVRSERIVRRRFAASEAAPILGAASDDERDRRFLACWTRKEAFGKALGVGIRYPMREFSLCDNLPQETKTIEHEGRAWSLRQLRPNDSTIACIVTNDRADRVQCANLDADAEQLSALNESH